MLKLSASIFSDINKVTVSKTDMKCIILRELTDLSMKFSKKPFVEFFKEKWVSNLNDK